MKKPATQILENLIDNKNNTLSVKVTPKSSSNRIKIENQDDGKAVIKIYVTCVPENGKANKEVIKLLAKELKIAKSSLEIIHGHTSNRKIIKLN